MANDYKVFLENWTVKDAVNYLGREGRRHHLVLNEAVSKIGGGQRIPLLSLVGVISDRVLFNLYEAYREVN